jgi:exodeoxyribonuclease X
MLIRSIDFETTGEPTPETPQAVCETGWQDIEVALDEHGSVIAAFLGGGSSMICDPARPMPAEARAVHHISDEDVAGCPPAMRSFLCLKEGSPAYFCAHQADYERTFFSGGDVPFICTYKVALRLWPDAPSHKLQVLRYWLALDIVQKFGLPAHRAGPDSYVGAALMVRILSEPDAPDLETMVRWSNGPALLPRINFGKHKGAKWSDLPTDYLEWIVDKSERAPLAEAEGRPMIETLLRVVVLARQIARRRRARATVIVTIGGEEWLLI